MTRTDIASTRPVGFASGKKGDRSYTSSWQCDHGDHWSVISDCVDLDSTVPWPICRNGTAVELNIMVHRCCKITSLIFSWSYFTFWRSDLHLIWFCYDLDLEFSQGLKITKIICPWSDYRSKWIAWSWSEITFFVIATTLKHRIKANQATDHCIGITLAPPWFWHTLTIVGARGASLPKTMVQAASFDPQPPVPTILTLTRWIWETL